MARQEQSRLRGTPGVAHDEGADHAGDRGGRVSVGDREARQQPQAGPVPGRSRLPGRPGNAGSPCSCSSPASNRAYSAGRNCSGRWNRCCIRRAGEQPRIPATGKSRLRLNELEVAKSRFSRLHLLAVPMAVKYTRPSIQVLLRANGRSGRDRPSSFQHSGFLSCIRRGTP